MRFQRRANETSQSSPPRFSSRRTEAISARSGVLCRVAACGDGHTLTTTDEQENAVLRSPRAHRHACRAMWPHLFISLLAASWLSGSQLGIHLSKEAKRQQRLLPLLRENRSVRGAALGESEMSSVPTGTSLPSGFSVLASFPDLLFIFEFVFGGLVWILVASSKVPIPILQGWVMFVSVFCFVITTSLLFLYFVGAHGGNPSWITLDAAYHSIASLFYLSAAVLEASSTIALWNAVLPSVYRENISAVVFTYAAMLIYVIHAVFSLRRWKSS
ncbi:myelin and lymphocyte protein [Ornithorhynchus anatinus]|uniref:Myelin and lymphocyte protein n=1 Tax=Ornithorhynchus anatinus TaxID=9258 RepID=F7DDU4_ORNAN|nr:myelin and lymphocyte protein [Ornithorhynchus anatinus]